MNKALIFPSRILAERAIETLTEAYTPGGVETVRIVSRGLVTSEEIRPAKPWAEVVELEDGRFAVPISPRKLAIIENREVMVRGENVRVPRLSEAVDLELVVDEAGELILHGGRPTLRGKSENRGVGPQ